MAKTWAIALHGGAGPLSKQDYSVEEAKMRDLLLAGGTRLDAGAKALDVAVDLVRGLEASGHHVAGKGASPNRAGIWELDAAVMDGANRKAGAVAALSGFISPVEVARGVMDETPHVLLVGDGAIDFATRRGFDRIDDPATYYAPAVTSPLSEDELQHGTVGAVVCDTDGHLAAATSTGGLLNKMPGRVGDSPLIGCGTWADERVAVSCTGQGEYFIRAAVAADISARVRYKRCSLQTATQGAMDDMGYLGGEGGLIAVDCLGAVSMACNAPGMKRGSLNAKGDLMVASRW